MHHELDPLQPQSEINKLIGDSLPQARFHHTVQAVFEERGQCRVLTYGGLHTNRNDAARFREALEKEPGFKGHCQVIELQPKTKFRPWAVCLDFFIHGKDDGTHGSTLNKRADPKNDLKLLAPQPDPQKWPGGEVTFW